MQKIVAEKRRRRHESTGSLDGTLITSDGQLLRQDRTTTDVVLRSSSGRPRTLSDSVLTDSPLRTFSEQQPGPMDRLSSGTVRPETSTRIVSEPVSSDVSLRTVSVSSNDGQLSSAEQLTSVILPQTESGPNCDSSGTFSDPATIGPDAQLVVAESSSSSETSNGTVIWQLDGNATDTLMDSARCTERGGSELSCSAIEMTDLSQHRPPPLIHRPPSTTTRPPTLFDRPDVFYTGSCLQVRLLPFIADRILLHAATLYPPNFTYLLYLAFLITRPFYLCCSERGRVLLSR